MLTRQINPDGSEEHFQYDGAGRRIAATDPLGRTIHWRYDGQGNLLGVQGSDGRSSQQRWGLPGTAQDGLLLQSASASGIHTHYAYDEWGRLTEVTVLAGELASTTRLQYQEGAPHTLPPANRAWADQPQAVIDPRGGRKTLSYNACGQPTRYTDCSGHTTRWQYDAWGELIEETDALGHHTRHQRDTVGRLLQTQQADGSLVQYRWADNGQVQAITLGAVAHRTSDTGLAPVTTTVTYEHDLWGRIIAQTQAGASLQMRYDSAGRVTELLNENHATTRFTYDSQDRLIQEVGFDGRSQAYRYDAAGQLIEKTDSQDSSLAAATEGVGTVRSRFHYDNAGRLTYRITAKAGAACEVDISHVNAEAPDNDLQIHQFSYSDSGELLSTQGWELSAEATIAQINDWLQLSTEQLRTVLNQQHDPQVLANNPWLQSLQVRYLQPSSRVDLQRDALGRTTGEVQTLYRLLDSLKSGANKTALATEFEHRIHHHLGALGERRASELQGIGQLDWLTYGSGHVHGVLLNQTPLLALERDKLHREVGRSLHLLQNGAAHEHAPAIITQTRQVDPLGRLLHQRWQGLPGHASAPQSAAPLIGGLQQRRYTYDSLGQLIGIQTPTEANAYQYDNRQRLIGQTHASAQGEHQHRWRLDPAGNRLPAKAAFQHLGAKTAASADWSAQVQQNLHDPQFNLLQPDQNPDTPAGQNIERWRDNRIGWSQEAESQGATHYRYDSWGNRTQALHSDGSITHLHYDSLHQLRQAVQRDPQGQELSRTTYRYDAFGRRVSKTHQTREQQSQTTHFGWDGDRLVHMETAEHIHHTVYEPGSFVPLLQVQRSKENAGQADAVKTLLGLGNSDASNALERELPREERELLHQALKEALQPGYQLSGLLPQELQAQVRESIQALKDAQAQTQEEHPLTIRHVLTDHLGTPIALVNANGEQLAGC